MPSKPILIGFTGPAGAGKSTAANILVTQYGFKRLSYADTLKSMLRVLLMDYGYDQDTAERYLNGDLKEVHCPALGTSSRYAQQALGTEWGRDRISSDLWTYLLIARMDRLRAAGLTRFVIDDVRMENEAQVIVNRNVGWNAHIFKVQPADNHPHRQPPAHRSEVGLPSFYITDDITHDWTLEMLSASIDEKIIRRFGITKEDGSKWQTT